MKSRSVRTFAVLASAGLILGAFVAAPADAAKKKKKPPACPAFASELAGDTPVNMVTDAHTAEAPLVLEIETPPGLGSSSNSAPAGGPTEDPTHGAPAHTFVPVQFDSAVAETGAYFTLEYTFPLDYDLWIRGDDGVAVAGAAGFIPGVPFLDGTGYGGHTGQGTENVEGLITADCTGYTVDIVSAATPGETVTLKMWTGEATYAPGS